MDLTRAVNAVVDATSGQYTPEQVLEILDIAAPIIAAQVLRDEAADVWSGEPAVEWTAGDVLYVLNGIASKLDPQ